MNGTLITDNQYKAFSAVIASMFHKGTGRPSRNFSQ
jgi:hypothetical protein